MTKGIVLFARNNSEIDYVKQAVFSCKKIKECLDLSVTLITDNQLYLEKNFKNHKFDNIILVNDDKNYTNKKYYDGSFSKRVLEFKNSNRSSVYDLTPYEETIVLDTDFIITNNIFEKCFEQHNDFLIYDSATDIFTNRDNYEFQYINDSGPKFYWATAFYFKKTYTNKIFFNLVKHVQENWVHYKNLYQIVSPVYRNDFAFSIAIHIMNGFCNGEFAKKMPGKMFYITDRDILLEIKNKKFTMLLENEKSFGNYFVATVNECNVHVMNKFSLGRIIDNDG